MRRLTHVGAMLALLGLFVGVGHAESSLSISLAEKDLGPGQTLLLGTVGAAFDLDADVLLTYQSKTGSVEGAVTVAYTSNASGMDADTIVNEREHGTSWDEIAGKHNLPPGLRKKSRGHPGLKRHLAGSDPYEGAVTIQFLAEYYDAGTSDLYAWLDSGLTIEDVALTLNLSSIRRLDPDDVVTLRMRGLTWERIASRYDISIDRLSRPADRSAGSSSAAAEHHGKGRGKGHHE